MELVVVFYEYSRTFLAVFKCYFNNSRVYIHITHNCSRSIICARIYIRFSYCVCVSVCVIVICFICVHI